MMNGLAQYLAKVVKKLQQFLNRGEKTLEELPLHLKGLDPESLEAIALKKMVGETAELNRRYTLKDTCAMVGVSHTLIYTCEEDGRLPPPDIRVNSKNNSRAGYTINQINRIREVVGTCPTRKKVPQIISMPNLKGGAGKTTVLNNLAHYLAILGHKVLILDSDPQGSMSFNFGKRPDIDVFYEHTFGPYMLMDDNALVEAGHPIGSAKNLHYAIQKTYWDNIDIIPACLENLNIDLRFGEEPLKSISAEQKYSHLRDGLLEVGAGVYDFILIDGTPSLNVTTLNILCACDAVFVPTPAAMLDYASTIKFINMMEQSLSSFIDAGVIVNFPDVRFFVTGYKPNSKYVRLMGNTIRQAFEVERGDVLKTAIEHSEEVHKASTRMLSIFEINPSEADNRARLKTTITNYTSLFVEILAALHDGDQTNTEVA